MCECDCVIVVRLCVCVYVCVCDCVYMCMIVCVCEVGIGLDQRHAAYILTWPQSRAMKCSLPEAQHYFTMLSVHHSSSEPHRTHTSQWGVRVHEIAEERTVVYHTNVSASKGMIFHQIFVLGAVQRQTITLMQSGSSNWSRWSERSCFYNVPK